MSTDSNDPKGKAQKETAKGKKRGRPETWPPMAKRLFKLGLHWPPFEDELLLLYQHFGLDHNWVAEIWDEYAAINSIAELRAEYESIKDAIKRLEQGETWWARRHYILSPEEVTHEVVAPRLPEHAEYLRAHGAYAIFSLREHLLRTVLEVRILFRATPLWHKLDQSFKELISGYKQTSYTGPIEKAFRRIRSLMWDKRVERGVETSPIPWTIDQYIEDLSLDPEDYPTFDEAWAILQKYRPYTGKYAERRRMSKESWQRTVLKQIERMTRTGVLADSDPKTIQGFLRGLEIIATTGFATSRSQIHSRKVVYRTPKTG